FVDPAYRGQGLAEKLVAKGVEKARKEQKKIIPLCPFAKKEFERKPEYADVWNQ
ncbi:MAG: GNAT family N-acetyltransferase, partial [Enterococcus casseliflavus]